MPVYGRPLGGAGSGSGLYGPGEGIKPVQPSQPPAPLPPISEAPPPAPAPVPAPVTLAFHVPGHAIPVTSEHKLELQALAYPTARRLAYEYAILTPSGEMMISRGDVPATLPGSDARTLLPLADGWLISAGIGGASLLFSDDLARARLSLQLPGVTLFPLTTLIDGHIMRNHALSWPWGGGKISQDDTYRLEIVGSDPPAGNEASVQIPYGIRARLIAATAALVTDATAANRIPSLQVNEANGGIRVLNIDTASQTASLSRTWQWLRGPWSGGARNIFQVDYGINEPGFIGDNSILSTSTIALQAGDNWGTLTLLVDAFIDASWDDQ